LGMKISGAITTRCCLLGLGAMVKPVTALIYGLSY